MNQEEISKVEILSIDINTDLCILINAMKNSDDNNLEIDDLILFVDRIYKASNEMRNIFVNSLDL